MILLDGALQYVDDVLNGNEITTWEVIRQCEIFKQEYEELQYTEEFEFYFDEEEIEFVETIVSTMNYGTGFSQGEPILPNLATFQCFLLVNVFGWRFKKKHCRFRYRQIMLYIARKNGKGTICAIIIILGLLMEQDYSEFYSICLSKDLSAELRKQIDQIIQSSPDLRDKFNVSKTWTGIVESKLTKSYYKPLTSDADTNNSIRGSYVIADEVGAYTTKANINALFTGQKSVINPMIFYTSSGYSNTASVMYGELEYCRKILRGDIVDKRYFCLIYYCAKDEIWEDIGLYRANPLRIEENYEEMRLFRNKAKENPADKIDHITKTCNIMMDTVLQDTQFLNMDLWRKTGINKIDLFKKRVTISIDLSKTVDLTSVSFMYKGDDGKLYCKSHGFIAEGTLNNPNRQEKIDYYNEENLENCTILRGDNSVKYLKVAKYIRDVIKSQQLEVISIYVDSTYAEVLEEELGYDYDVIEINTSPSNLGPITSRFRDLIYDATILHEENSLLDYCAAYSLEKYNRGMVTINKNRNDKAARIDLFITVLYAFIYWYDEFIEDYDPLESLKNASWRKKDESKN